MAVFSFKLQAYPSFMPILARAGEKEGWGQSQAKSSPVQLNDFKPFLQSERSKSSLREISNCCIWDGRQSQSSPGLVQRVWQQELLSVWVLNVWTLDQKRIFAWFRVQSVHSSFQTGDLLQLWGFQASPMSSIPGWTGSSALRATGAAGIQKDSSQRLKWELKMSPLPTFTSLQHLLSGRDVLWDRLWSDLSVLFWDKLGFLQL